MYIYMYKITNKLNNKEYIGVHKTEYVDDNYMGSGTAITNAIKKYGKNQFNKEILEYFNTEEEAYIKESQIVNEDYVKLKNTYNQTVGGKRPPSRKNIPMTDEQKQKIKKWANSEQGKASSINGGKIGWKRKGGWTQEEIEKRVQTSHQNNMYSKDMSKCHTPVAIQKRTQTRKLNGIVGDTTHCHTELSRFKREKTKILNLIKKIENHYGKKFNMDLLKQARKERVSYLTDKTLFKYFTHQYFVTAT